MDLVFFCSIVTEHTKSFPFYVNSVGMNNRERSKHRKKGFITHQLLFSKSGTGTVVTNGKTQMMNPGDVLYLAPYSVHNYKRHSDEWVTHWITYSGRGVPIFGNFSDGIYTTKHFDEIEKILKEIISVKSHPQFDSISSAMLYKILTLCHEDFSSGISANAENKLQPVIKYIRKNYNRVIELSDLSECIGVTNEHLCYLFKTLYNVRPFEYINMVRIQKAKNLIMANRDLSMQEIAKQCGFNSASYFAARFKEYEKISPSKFIH